MVRRVVAVVIGLSLGIGLGAQSSPSPEVLLKAAKQREVVDGDLSGALAQFTSIVDKFAKNHVVAAEALMHIAGIEDRQGHSAAARQAYSRIINEFADAGTPVDAAKKWLAANAPPSTAAAAQLATDGPFASESIRPRLPPLRSGYDFAPDGKSFVFVLLTGGGPATQATLVLRNLETGQDRVLAPLPGLQLGGVPRFSRNGRFVAVSVGTGTPELVKEQIVVFDVTKPGALPITTPGLTMGSADVQKLQSEFVWNHRLAWSEDGLSLAYLVPSETPHLFDCRVLDVLSGQSRSIGVTVEDKPDFRWSAHGELAIHVTRAAAGTDELVVVAPSGQMRRLSVSAAEASARYIGSTYSLALTRLGKWTTNGEIALAQRVGAGHWIVSLVAPGTGHLSKTCEGLTPYLSELLSLSWIGMSGGSGERDQCMQITADGRSQIIWKSASKHLVIHDTHTGAERNVTRGSGEEDYGFLSNDDRTIVFVSNRDRDWALYAAPLNAAPVANPVLLGKLNSVPRSMGIRWTPDSLIAQWSTTEENVFRINVDPATGHAIGEVDRLTQDNVENKNPAISPNGKRIAYYAVTGAKGGLAVMDADGSNERIVAPFRVGSLPSRPVWRSNDEVIASPWQLGPTGVKDIVVVNVNTGAVKTAVTLENVALDGNYLRTSDEIVYITPAQRSDRERSIRAASLTTGRSRELLRLDASDGRLDTVCVSPDGLRLGYVLQKDPNDASSSELGILTLADGHRTVIATNRNVDIDAVGWSPDGRFLLYGANVLRVIDTSALAAPDPRGDAQGSWPLVAEPGGLPTWSGTGSWSPDGTFVVVSQYGLTSDWRQWHGVTADAVAKYAARTGR